MKKCSRPVSPLYVVFVCEKNLPQLNKLIHTKPFEELKFSFHASNTSSTVSSTHIERKIISVVLFGIYVLIYFV